MDRDIGYASLAEQDREHSRRSFLKTAAAVGAALTLAGTGGAQVFTWYADAQQLPTPINHPTYPGLGNVAIFSFALRLERLEGTFYA
jgi:TAT (twin-arginine translocation) pathway signal sequence